MLSGFIHSLAHSTRICEPDCTVQGTMLGWGLPLRSRVLLLFSWPLYSHRTSCLLSPQTRTMLLFLLCWSFALPRTLFPQIRSWIPPSLPSGLYSERLAQVPPKKPSTQSPYYSSWLFCQCHRWTFYTVHLFTVPAGEGSKLTPAGALPARLLPRHFGQCSTQGRCWHYLLIPCWMRMEGRPLMSPSEFRELVSQMPSELWNFLCYSVPRVSKSTKLNCI